MERNKILIFIFSVVLQSLVYSQGSVSSMVTFTISPVALLDIAPAGNISFNSSNLIDEAGRIPTYTNNTNKWINITSAISTGGTNRSVFATILTGTIPAGISLEVQAINGNGNGDIGSSTGWKELDMTNKEIITNIGRTWTRNGANRGWQLEYKLEFSSFPVQPITGNVVTISYTLMDN